MQLMLSLTEITRESISIFGVANAFKAFSAAAISYLDGVLEDAPIFAR